MIYRVRVPQSNTIFSRLPLNNSGGDPQITIQSNNGDVARILLKSNIDTSSVIGYDGCNLVIYPSNADLHTSRLFELGLYQINGSWDAGFNINTDKPNPQLQGSSWANKYDEITWNDNGGDYDQNTEILYQLNHKTIYNPIKFKLTNDNSSDGFLPENGYLLKIKEQDVNVGRISLYSANTNAPLFPVYQFYIDDRIWDSSDYPEVENIDNFICQIKDFQEQYKLNQTIRFNLQFFPKKYSKDWTSSYWTQTDKNYHIPDNFYGTYAIYDTTQIERIPIIEHSSYTRLSYDGISNYFVLILSQFIVNRRDTIQLKMDNRIYDKGTFRIV